MSKQSLKQRMSINQRDNRMKLEKYQANYSKVTNHVNLNHQQEEVAAFAQNTLREKVDTAVFMKSPEDKEFVKTMKVRTKGQLL
jgi:hypothetical protein